MIEDLAFGQYFICISERLGVLSVCASTATAAAAGINSIIV